MKVLEDKYRRPVFQGDLMILRVDALPENAREVDSQVIAHSETGHHHVAERARVFDVGDLMTLYLKCLGRDGIDIVHKRPFDTHETLRLLGNDDAVWQVRRQREYVPDGWRRVED